MTRLDESKKRLDDALSRLESAVEAQLRSNREDEDAAAALLRARSDYTALKQVTETVRGRLDDTIVRLESVLEA